MNIAAFTGRMTADPKSHKTVCTFVLAVYRSKDETDFIPCVAFKKTAEMVLDRGKKGMPLAVSGSFKLNTWKSKDGEDRSQLNLMVNHVEFLASDSGAKKQTSKKQAPPPDTDDTDTDYDNPFGIA